MNKQNDHPVIALTPGEPAGIGLDLALMHAKENLNARLVALADPELLASRMKKLHLDISLNVISPDLAIPIHQPGRLNIIPFRAKVREISPGVPRVENASYVLETIRFATQGCIDKQFDAMVTGPVHKGIINDAGYPFTGHTEFIADLCQANPVMMLATPGLRVALVTTHLPLSRVPASITEENLTQVIDALLEDLRRKFGIPNPRVLVCGLNPHAGENGHLGTEETEIITPVIGKYQKQGVDLAGPLPADTVFTPEKLANADAVLAMYHDQGLPVLKHMGFGQAINITLGLPIIRTSVDHGTAFDLAGTGKAHTGSIKAAIDTAISLARSSYKAGFDDHTE